MSGDDTKFDAKATLDVDLFLTYELETSHSDFIPSVLGLVTRPHLKLLDVGGASGVFLNEIMTATDQPLEATNLEFMGDYASKQVSNKIGFIEGSILESDIPDDSYDLVTFRHILHHLVADSVPQTLANQKHALAEMLRIVKPGGHLVFEEELNQTRLFSRIVYHLSKWAHRSPFKSRFFKGAGSVVVSFLTPKEIAAMLAELRRTRPLEIVKHSYEPWNLPLRWKVTVLMANVGSVLYSIRVGDATA
jgi:ubiquinone/menaquinone biosynthesis C-methylase UbiE